MKLEYSYTNIRTIKRDLENIVNYIVGADGVGQEVKGYAKEIQKQIYSYDALLKEIGSKGKITVLSNLATYKGLQETEKLIWQLKKELGIVSIGI